MALNEFTIKTETEKKIPLYKEWFTLGEGKGISLALWENNIQLQRRERDDNKVWNTTQEINLAKPVLEKLFIRLPTLFRAMKEEDQSG
jgi:hypothetical protein